MKAGGERDLRQLASPEVAIVGAGLWLPGYASLERWKSTRRDPLESKPTGDALGRIHRRRAGPLGRALCDASAEALRNAGVDPATVAIVVGSSIGEAETLVRLLDQMWRGTEPVSPADFTTSVHNAASGVMSIAWENRGFTTSLAADFDTPASALLEGIGLAVTTDAPVLVACADEAAPRTLLSGPLAWDLAAGALVLAPLGAQAHCLARMRIVWPSEDGPESIAPPDLDPGAVLNPQAGMLDLVDAIARESRGLVRLDRGAGAGYRALLAPQAAR